MRLVIGKGDVGSACVRDWNARSGGEPVWYAPGHLDERDHSIRFTFDSDPERVIVATGAMHQQRLTEPFSDSVSDATFAGAIEANLTSQMRTLWDLVERAPELRSVLFIGSMAHRRTFSGMAVYGAAKAGLDQFVRVAAYELAPRNICVQVLHPTNIWGTRMQRRLAEDVGESNYDASRRLPGRLHVDDVAHAAVELVELGASIPYMSGNVIELNGGER